MTANTLRHECDCGHDRSSHHWDPATGKWGACMAFYSDCTEYRDKHAPKPGPHAANCFCRGCSERKVRGHG